ncbi:hypothetical protein KSU1_C0541 [Candidatus Jettenia caeni]|uniref:Uncharacterized protein n=1 Tax=Candidatus Jettenia caeni TaxID=247490 RepID=I3IK92_9BACT|nr:hypothetical protein KSU1_C0541 [Candidatus Jettenia caeni]
MIASIRAIIVVSFYGKLLPKNYEMKQHIVSNRLIRDMSRILRYYLSICFCESLLIQVKR